MSRPAWAPTAIIWQWFQQGRTHVMQQIPSKEVFLVDAFNGHLNKSAIF